MSKFGIATIGVLLLCLGTHGQEPTAKPIWPVTSHDFGAVPRGAQLLHRFAWTNTTDRPIEIVESRVSCGCATVAASPRLLQPGESGTLDVSIDARRFVGSKTVSIQLLLGPENPVGVTLQVSATSRQDVVFNPGQIHFGFLQEGAEAIQTLDVEYAGPLDYRIDRVEAPTHLEAAIEPLYKKPGQVGHRLKVKLLPTAPAGDLRQVIQLHTNDSQNSVLNVLVDGVIRSDVMVIPQPLHLGTVPVGQSIQRRVTLRGSEPFRILKADCMVSGVTVNFPMNESRVHSVQVSWKPLNSHDTLHEIVLHTNIPKHPLLKVAIQGSAGE